MTKLWFEDREIEIPPDQAAHHEAPVRGVPWAAVVLVLFAALLMVPVIGTHLATMSVFVSLFPLAPFATLRFTLERQFGIHGAYLDYLLWGIPVLVWLLFAARSLSRYAAPRLNAAEKRRRLNTLILVLGLPIVAAIAYWRFQMDWRV